MTNLWNTYNQTRLAGDKKTANKLLREIIEVLKQKEQKCVTAFVADLCEKTIPANEVVASNGTAVSSNTNRIQHPIFKEIILPVLATHYLKGSPLHTKWIGQFEQFFYTDNNTTKAFLKTIHIDGHFSAAYFFEKSFAIDNNQDALHLLLQRTAQDIEYFLHELPFAVLVEPHILNNELSYFETYWNKSDNKEKWTIPLKRWQNSAKHWTNYYAAKGKYTNFMAYQEALEIELD